MFDEIMPNLYALVSGGSSSNSYLLKGNGKEGCALIDTGLPENAALLKGSLAALGLSSGDVRLILHTHGHADHFGADFTFPKAQAQMHRHDAEFVNREDAEFTCSHFFGRMNFPKIKKFLKDRQTLDFAGFGLDVIHTPGHTQGSVCFHERRKGLLFSGDTLFNGSFGRYDLPSGGRAELLRSMKLLQGQDFSVLLSGHGPILEGKAEQAKNMQACIAMLR